MPSVRPRLPARRWFRLTLSCFVSIVGIIAFAGSDATGHHGRSLGPTVNGKIAFSSGGDNDSGNLEIHTVGPNGTGETRLTKHGPSGEVVGWSAGGRKIVIWPGSLWTLNPDGTNPTRISHGDAQLSPTGRVVASFNNAGDIELRTPSGRKIRLIRTHLGGSILDSPAWPVWAPDEKSLAYYVYLEDMDHSRIYVVNSDGTRRRSLSHGRRPLDSSPRWSPDGRQIAFLHDRSPRANDNELYVMKADGTKRVQLARHLAPGGYRWRAVAFAWSPEGDAIAYVGSAGGIYVVRVDGSGAARVAFATKHASAPAWSPSGRTLAFTDRNTLWVVGSHGGRPKALVRRQGLLGVAWSPGRRLAFNIGGVFGEVFTVDADGTRLERLTRQVADDHPVWSPGGRYIAFVRGPHHYGDESFGAAVWVMKADGSGARRLSAGFAPSWAPDARRLTFVERNEKSHQPERDGYVSVVNLDGSGKRRLARGTDPVWSPDGKYIAFIKHKFGGRGGYVGNSTLHLITADGSGDRVLLSHVVFFGNDEGNAAAEIYSTPVWSPDGTHLALTAVLEEVLDPERQGYVYEAVTAVVDRDGIFRILHSGESIEELAWSPDGAEIGRLSSNRIDALRSDGTRVTKLASGPYSIFYRNLVWAPDATRVAFAACRDPGYPETCQIYFANRDGSAIRNTRIKGASVSWQSRTETFAAGGVG